MMITEKKLSQALERMGYSEDDFELCSECGEYCTRKGSSLTHIPCNEKFCPSRWNGDGNKYQTVYVGLPFRALIRKE